MPASTGEYFLRAASYFTTSAIGFTPSAQILSFSAGQGLPNDIGPSVNCFGSPLPSAKTHSVVIGGQLCVAWKTYDFPSLLHTPQQKVWDLSHPGSSSCRLDPSRFTSHKAELAVSMSLALNRIRCPSGERRGLNGFPLTSASFFSFVPLAEMIQTSWPFTETSSSPSGDHDASSTASFPRRADATLFSGILHNSRFFAPARVGDASRLM